jgi:uncharacterized protein YjbI with pentapeptide repeats
MNFKGANLEKVNLSKANGDSTLGLSSHRNAIFFQWK